VDRAIRRFGVFHRNSANKADSHPTSDLSD
jgi:hypothetical protein